ncbi:MAG: transporter permease [Bacillota bacterium]|jgi:NitT/TauT family transport system permease protein|nr:transporter permease [Bacillota bacterium]
MNEVHDKEYTTLSSERNAYLKGQKRTQRLIFAWQIGILLQFLFFWELFARMGIIDSFILSQPSRIASTFVSMAKYDLLLHVGVTVYETLVGFVLGVIIGTALAVVLWWSSFISKISEPYLVVLNSLPKIALGPVIIIIVGAGTEAIIFMALAISLIVTVLEMLNGFRHTNREYIRMASTFGATKGQIFLKVVFPYNISTLFNSLKINIGLSLVGVIAGEFLVSKAGLGYLIVYGGQVFKMDLVMASVIILAIVAALMYQGVVLLQKLAMRWYSH